MSNPYDPPPHPASLPPGNWDPVSLDPPPTIMWFKIYMVALVLLHLLIVGLGFFFGVMAQEIASSSTEVTELRIMGFVYVLWGLSLTVLFGATFFLPNRPWVWIFNLVAICISIISGCCIIIPIVLIIFWVRQDVRTWYGMQ
jgi:hypothetical protein